MAQLMVHLPILSFLAWLATFFMVIITVAAVLLRLFMIRNKVLLPYIFLSVTILLYVACYAVYTSTYVPEIILWATRLDYMAAPAAVLATYVLFQQILGRRQLWKDLLVGVPLVLLIIAIPLDRSFFLTNELVFSTLKGYFSLVTGPGITLFIAVLFLPLLWSYGELLAYFVRHRKNQPELLALVLGFGLWILASLRDGWVTASTDPDVFTLPWLGPILLSLSIIFYLAIYLRRTHLENKQKIEDYQKHLRELLDQRTGQMVEAVNLGGFTPLLAGVAHEINTPLGIAITAESKMAEDRRLLAEAFAGGTMKKSDLETWMSASQELHQLVAGNLQRVSVIVDTFRKIGQDRKLETPTTFHMREYLDDLAATYAEAVSRQNVQVDIDCDPGLVIMTWFVSLTQILSALIHNSLTHAFAGQTGGRLAISAAVSDEKLLLTVADNGCGMDADTQARIYEPFFSTRKNQGHLGLGLSLVQNLVQQKFQGQLAVSSQPGSGTEFKLELPLKAVHSAG